MLFVGSRFYNYFDLISDALARAGYDVEGLVTSIARKSLAVRMLSKVGLRGAFRKKQLRNLHAALGYARTDNDIVLVINGANLTPADMEFLRAVNPRARFIFYTWDSLAKYPENERLLPYFDKVSSFDPRDCELHPEFHLRPLFFSKSVETDDSSRDYKWSVAFIGTDRPGRYELLKKIKRNSSGSASLPPFLYLQTSVLRMLMDRLSGGALCHNRLLPYERFLSINEEAQCALDIQETTGQSGLTMRTIEMLAIGKYLYTTNPYIASHPYISPDSYTVLDTDHPG